MTKRKTDKEVADGIYAAVSSLSELIKDAEERGMRFILTYRGVIYNEKTHMPLDMAHNFRLDMSYVVDLGAKVFGPTPMFSPPKKQAN